MNQVRELLKLRTRELRMPRIRLAARLGVSPEQLMRWELGDEQPPPTTLERWSCLVQEALEARSR